MQRTVGSPWDGTLDWDCDWDERVTDDISLDF
jgi:hypothetical protein